MRNWRISPESRPVAYMKTPNKLGVLVNKVHRLMSKRNSYNYTAKDRMNNREQRIRDIGPYSLLETQNTVYI